MIQRALADLLDRRDLSREESREAMEEIMRGEATPSQIAGFLIALRAKGETVDEIAGCAEAMRAHVLAVRPARKDLVDTAGTGGDGARAQVVGVYSPHLVRTIADVLAQLGSRRAFVVHGAGGIDELSPCGPNEVCEVVDGNVVERIIEPDDLGIHPCSVAELRGGSPEENAAAIREVFAGAGNGRRDAILLNAAGAIAAGGHAEDLREGIERARRALDSGAARE